MLSFAEWAGLIISILIFYFTWSFTLKKESVDIFNSMENNNERKAKINIRKTLIKSLKLITINLIVFLTILFCFPYILPYIMNIPFDDFNIIIDTNLWNFLYKFMPFEKELFSNSNFTFSFITGIVLSIIIETMHLVVLHLFKEVKFIFKFIIFSLVTYGLIWADRWISFFLVEHIKIFFVLLSLVINIIIYFVIGIIVYFVVVFVLAMLSINVPIDTDKDKA